MLVVTSLLALLVGVSLGIMGGGGSILMVPILRYVLGLEAHAAIALSMLVVGTTSLAALVPHARRKRVRWKVGATFGAAGMVGAFLAGRLTQYIPGFVLLVGFAIMMFATAYAMLRQPRRAQLFTEGEHTSVKIVVQGFSVGAITGLLGAGGGFVVVPALVLLTRLPMDVAVGTSLVVVAMNTAAGFLGLVGHVPVDARSAVIISVAAVLGSVAGGLLGRRISPAALKTSFGWFVVAMAFFIMAQELVASLHHTPSIFASLIVSASSTLALATVTRWVRARTAKYAQCHRAG